MPITQNKSKDLIHEKQNKLVQLWRKLKHSIFDVLFVVMDQTAADNEEVTIMGVFWEAGIDYMQMMQFPFNFTIIMVWNGGETLNNVFKLMSSVLSINQFMPSLNYNAFLAFLYFLNFMIILIILDIIYVSYSFNKKKFRFTLPLIILAKVVPIFLTILFITIMEFLLGIINCNPSETDPNIQVMQYFPQIQCFVGAHIIHVSITLFFTTIFVFISTVVAMTLFQPRMRTATILARKSSEGQIIFIILKVICQFFFSFTPFDGTWTYVALMFFPGLILFYFYQFHEPHYNKDVGKLYQIFSSYFFWTISMLTLSQVCILLNIDFQGAMVIWFCGLPFIALNIAFKNKSNIDSLFSSNLKFRTGEDLQAHLQYVLQLINERKTDENSNMLLVGYIEKHIETCVQDDCPIKFKRPKKEELLAQMDQNCQLLIIQIERMFRQGIKKFPKSTKLHISFALFYFQFLKQKAKAYEEFVMAEHASPSFTEEFIVYRFKKIIKDKLEEVKEQQQESDLIEIIRFDNHVSLCEEAMVQSAKLHKEFWSELMEETPNLAKLNDMGSKIISIVNSVRLNYYEVNKINSHSAEIIHNYGVYTMFISQNIKEGKKGLVHAKRAFFEKKAKGELLSGKNNIMEGDFSSHSLVVSAAESFMGKILSVNDNFIQMSGYLKEEITEKTIEKLLPQVFGFYHEYAMTNWLKDSQKLYIKDQKNSYLHQVHHGFIKQKNGFIIPVQYRVTYNIFQEKFYVFIKNQKEFNEQLHFRIYIITDHKGAIKEVSSLGFSYFNLSKDILFSNQRFVDEYGINFNNDLYQAEGNVITIAKKVVATSPEIVQEKKLEPQIQIQQENDQFFVKASKIWMPAQEAEEDDEELLEKQKNSLKNGKKDIGTVIVLEKLIMDKMQNNDIILDSLNDFGKDITHFYELNEMSGQDQGEDQQSPMVVGKKRKNSKMQMAVSNFIEAEKGSLKEKSFIKYGQRIKTYRLVKGELKRVVEAYGTEDSEYDEENEAQVGLSKFETAKLKDPLFVEKIKSAINTDIDHEEVFVLKLIFTIFIIGLLTSSILSYIFVGQQFSKMQAYSHVNMQRVQDMFYINNLIHLSFNATDQQNVTSSFMNNTIYASEYYITFDPDVQIELLNGDGQIDHVRLNTALIWAQGYLFDYFRDVSLLYNSTTLLFYNYYNHIYPALESFTLQTSDISPNTIVYSFVILIVLTLVIVIIWIYNIMLIDKKCSDIILWFLDIPILYVTYLQNNCITYLKSHTPVDELLEKGINFHDKNLFLEEFNTGSDKEEDNEFNEENKSRKIMIARYKKKTLISRCNFMYVQMVWLLLYSAIISTVFLITQFNFFAKQWDYLYKQFIWSSTIPNNLRLLVEQKVQIIGGVNISDFQLRLQSRFMNPIQNGGLNGMMEDLAKYGGVISDYYLMCFVKDICQFERYSEPQATRCKDFLSSKLEGGIQSVFSYYPQLQPERYMQIEHVQYDYINVLLLEIFTAWQAQFNLSITSASNTLTLVLALYLIFSFVGYIFIWPLYIWKLNVKLNQTIQMLNMIPMKMLPKSRKDIRDFFSWIIKESNKNKTVDI